MSDTIRFRFRFRAQRDALAFSLRDPKSQHSGTGLRQLHEPEYLLSPSFLTRCFSPCIIATYLFAA